MAADLQRLRQRAILEQALAGLDDLRSLTGGLWDRLQTRVEALAVKTHRTTKEDVGTFYWAVARGPDVPIAFRKSTEETGRTVDEICMPELLALARQVLAIGATGDEAVIVMARELGLQRLRAASRERFETAMRTASAS